MFQSFEDESQPSEGPARLAKLRKAMAGAGLDAWITPRADRFQGEYVAPCDARLAWLTGFTGSAGFCIATSDRAGVFVDGRYRIQVRAQTDPVAFTPVNWPETAGWQWLKTVLNNGGKVGFDPWLHTLAEIEDYERALGGTGILLVPTENLIDGIWTDRPAPPAAPVRAHPVEYAGRSAREKRSELTGKLGAAGQSAAVLTSPESLCWLLNIRGGDIPRVPIVHAHAIASGNGDVAVFSDPAKFAGIQLDPGVTLHDLADFEARLGHLSGKVLLAKSAAFAIRDVLQAAGVTVEVGEDPCLLPKACKNEVELQGARDAHHRDALAMVRFLCWLDEAAPTGRLTEIRVAERLEKFRRETNMLQDISFDTIAASGPNAALPHYRVTRGSDRPVVPGDVLLVDSGGQYLDGTTDITRTIATGQPEDDEVAAFTRVLKGMIAISRARFPRGLAGRDLDALARYPLWLAGQDYDHGTGHGVGSYLSVHEGPQRLSRLSATPLVPGMILSNEPGYYREDHFGIRIENLIAVIEAEALHHDDHRDMLAFETLTYVPIDKRLIDPALLSADEIAWLNTYHGEVAARFGPDLSGKEAKWLRTATAPL